MLVGAQAELAVLKPLVCVVSSTASARGPCFGFIEPPPLLSHLLRYLDREMSLGPSACHILHVSAQEMVVP